MVISSTSTVAVYMKPMSALLAVGASCANAGSATSESAAAAPSMPAMRVNKREVISLTPLSFARLVLLMSKRCIVGFTRADAERMVDWRDEDFSIADLAGFGGLDDRFDGLVDLRRRNDDLDLDLREEAHGVFGTAVNLGVTFLAPVAFDFGDRHALQPDVGQRLADLLELEGLDDGCDEFHSRTPLLCPALFLAR